MSSGSKGNRKTRLNRSKDNAPESRSRRRLQFASAPLEGKSFFLHVQSASKARELEKKLNELGGVVEKFLSKELDYVITDQPTASQPSFSPRKRENTNLTQSITRGQTRAQAILQKSVKQRKQSAKSTDVLTNAKKWKIQVLTVEQVLRWIDALKKRRAIVQPTGRVCSLRGAFIKIEDHCRQYKPLVRELNVWPRLNLDAAPGFSPFDEPVSMRTRSRSSSKSPRRGAKRQPSKRSTGSAGKKGYCELCDAHYVGMEKHVNSRRHKLVASQKDTYAELDRLIGRGKSLKQFEEEMKRKRASKTSVTQRQTRSQTRSRSPVNPKPSPRKSKNTPRKTTPSPRRRTTPSRQSRTPSPGRRTPNRQSRTPSSGRRTTSRQSQTPPSGRRTPNRQSRTPPAGRRTASRQSRTPSPGRRTPNRQSRTPSPGRRTPSRQSRTPSSGRRTPSRQSRTPSSGRRTPNRQSGTSSPARRRPRAARKAQQRVTPITIVRYQDDKYSVVKSTTKKRRRNESDNASHSKLKQKKADRYSIVESTPMKIRLRRSRRKRIQCKSRAV